MYIIRLLTYIVSSYLGVDAAVLQTSSELSQPWVEEDEDRIVPWAEEAKLGYDQKKTYGYYNTLRGEEVEYIKKKPLRGDNYKKKKKNQMFAKAGKDSSDECYSKKKKKKQQKKTKKSKKKKQQLAIRKSKGKSDGYVVKEKKKLYPYKRRRILNSEVESTTTAELSGNSVLGRIGLTKMNAGKKSKESTTLSGKSEKSGRISKCRTATKAGKESRSTGKSGKDSPTHVPSVSPKVRLVLSDMKQLTLGKFKKDTELIHYNSTPSLFTLIISQPTSDPLESPSKSPSKVPSVSPSKEPSRSPSSNPTKVPTGSPIVDENIPVFEPTTSPSKGPSLSPSSNPTDAPTGSPSKEVRSLHIL